MTGFLKVQYLKNELRDEVILVTSFNNGGSKEKDKQLKNNKDSTISFFNERAVKKA